MGGHVGGVLCYMIINKMNVKLKFVVKGKKQEYRFGEIKF